MWQLDRVASLETHCQSRVAGCDAMLAEYESSRALQAIGWVTAGVGM